MFINGIFCIRRVWSFLMKSWILCVWPGLWIMVSRQVKKQILWKFRLLHGSVMFTLICDIHTSLWYLHASVMFTHVHLERCPVGNALCLDWGVFVKVLIAFSDYKYFTVSHCVALAVLPLSTECWESRQVPPNLTFVLPVIFCFKCICCAG